MTDFFHINDGSANKSVFYANGPAYVTATTVSTSFQTWQKPNGINFIHFFVLGAGGGGGNSSNTIANGGRGGGGGGSAGFVTGLFPASVLPDTLYINVGVGGVGGDTGTGNGSDGSGGSGALSYVMIYPDTAFTASNVVLQSGSAAAVGGRTGGSVSAGGQAGTAWTPTGSILSNLGLIATYAGQAGPVGQTTVAASNVLISGITTGGAPGGGTNNVGINGGSIIGYGNTLPTISGGTTASTLTINGSGNYMPSRPNTVGMTYGPMFFSGGAGGASGLSTGGNGGKGGDGAFGSGGGGGGNAMVTGNRGIGGRGGDGLVIITCW